jgi:hypothetical protein
VSAMSGGQSEGGYSIFHKIMADMTFPELVQAAADRAVVLWGLGVIEQPMKSAAPIESEPEKWRIPCHRTC